MYVDGGWMDGGQEKCGALLLDGCLCSKPVLSIF